MEGRGAQDNRRLGLTRLAGRRANMYPRESKHGADAQADAMFQSAFSLVKPDSADRPAAFLEFSTTARFSDHEMQKLHETADSRPER